MLCLLTGSDRSAVSARLMQELCQAARLGKTGQVLIVPEQFSHEAERRLCAAGGDSISRYGEVLSFSRLADRVSAVSGGVARTYLDQGGRLLAMALAAEQTASRIHYFAAGLRRPEFLTDLLGLVDEFTSYDVQPETLLAVARAAEGEFSVKLEELALLYESYMAVCACGSADPSEKLDRLCRVLPESTWPRDKTFYIDGFSDFTGQELQVLEHLIRNGQSVFVGLTTGQTETAMTRPARETARTLRLLGEKVGAKTGTVQCREAPQRDPGVQILLDAMFGTGTVRRQSSDNVFLRGFDSVEDECRHAVQRVQILVEKGARYRDIHVACADPAAYEAALRSAFLSAKIPTYFSGENDILGKPVPGAVLSALAAATGPLDYAAAAVYLKSGLPLLDRDRCDRLDCYAYRWNLRGAQWDKPLEFHPRGFGLDWLEDDREELARLEADRQTAMGPLLRLRGTLKTAADTGEMVLAVHGFLEDIRLRQRLEKQASDHAAAGRGQLAQEIAQLYEILCVSLEQMWLILGRTVRSSDDFYRMYRLLLTQYQVGTIPAGLDQVHISSVADLRQRNSPHLLVLGAADGVFPAYRAGEGLLTEEERRCLVSGGLSLAPSRADQMDREMSSIQAALCAASDSIWLSYAGDQPAWLVQKAAAAFPGSFDCPVEEAVLDVASLAAHRVRENDTTPLHVPGLDAMEAALRQLREYAFTSLSPERVQGLYGRQINLSASRIDKYAACRFAFFLTYGLKAQPRRRAQLDPAAYGTMVHEILENTVRRVMEQGDFRSVSEEILLDIALDEMERYVHRTFPRADRRAAWLFARSRQEILAVVRDLGQELRNSKFQPAACELEFSRSGQLGPVEVQGKQALCRISGFVDRVDLYEEDGRTYVRVVDYKTGHKDFDYTDILSGAGLQMLIYLFALRRFGGDYFGKEQLEPAGVLYMPARKDHLLTPPLPDDAFVEKEHAAARRRKGLVLSREQILAAMEADPDAPQYMPYKTTKSGLAGDLATAEQLDLLERHVMRTLANMTDSIASGDVTPNPTVRGLYSPCRWCDYADVCHWDLCPHSQRELAATSADLFWEKLEEEDARHG